MRICIYGAGSLGSTVGGLLAGTNAVTLIGRRVNTEAISRNGLRLTGVVDDTVDVEALDRIGNAPPPDLLIVTTKAYNTAAVIEACDGWVEEGTRVLTLQNGLGNLDRLRAWKGSMAFGATTTMGATMLSPGVVKVVSTGETVIGSDMDLRGASSIAHMLKSSGMSSTTSENIKGEIWLKAIVNACINPMTAVLRVPNGRLLESKAVVELMRHISTECESVAASSGINLPVESVFERILAVARQTSANRSSMLQDIERGRRTEIDSINGHICRLGEQMGLPTPLNRMLVAAIESLEADGVEKG